MTSDFPMQRRGGKGIFAIKLKDGDSLVDFHLVGSDAGGSLSTWSCSCGMLCSDTTQ